ncbi:MAG: SDR family NAD(P)-dependent oxidoreductase [Myxococcota bacterium]
MAGLSEYRDRVAVVTGASSGIGAELARELGRRGSRVALVARRRERLEQLAGEIREAGGRASVHVCDVAERIEVAKAAEAVLAEWGAVDLLVNNAGYVRHVLFKNHDVDDIERMMRTNYLGAVYWIKAVLPQMSERGSGWIVNISSFAGIIPQPDEAAYAATKFALTGLSESIVYELEPLGIHVLAVHPVLVRTEMFSPEVIARMPPAGLKQFIEAPEFVRETVRALERGEHTLVVPRRFRAVHVLRTLFPRSVGRTIARVKLKALPDSPQRARRSD